MSCSMAAPGSARGAACLPFATIGLPPQDLKYKGEPTGVRGRRADPWCANTSTIHRGSVGGDGSTRVGADCLLMASAHVGA